MSELWKPIPSFPNYEASSFGRIRHIRFKRILAQNPGRGGYLLVNAGTKTVRVNRAVCEAFHGPAPSDSHHASHLDNNKLNNSPSNLTWHTSKENHANQPLRSVGINNPRAKLTEEDIRTIRSRKANGERADHIRLDYPQVSRSMVYYIVQRKAWRHL